MNKKYFDWDTDKDSPEGIKGKANLISSDVSKKWMDNFNNWIITILPYQYDVPRNTQNFELSFDENFGLMLWAERNFEGRWTFIYSYSHLHLFFENKSDQLKFILKA